MDRISLVTLLLAAAFTFFHYASLSFARGALGARLHSLWAALLAAADTAAVLLLIGSGCRVFWVYLLVLALHAAQAALMRPGSLSGLALLGGLFPFVLVCMHGVMIPLMAMLSGMNMYDLMRAPYEDRLSLLCALLLCYPAALLVRGRMTTPGGLALLLRCREQRRLVGGALLLLLAYLLMESYVYDYKYPRLWTPAFHLITSVVALAAFSMVIWYAVDTSAYIEEELKTRQVEKQLQRQVLHYQEYTRTVNEMRSFKHDYKRMSQTLRTLVAAGDRDKALELLGMMDGEMENLMPYTRFSNHVVVDAILQECAGLCRERGVAFSAVAKLPESAGLDDLELCRIFGNLIDNACEACERISEGERFIRVESAIGGGWATVELANSYSGRVELAKDGLPATSKVDKAHHGLGLVSVRQLVESKGGFLQVEADQEKRVFTVRLHFPVPESPFLGK